MRLMNRYFLRATLLSFGLGLPLSAACDEDAPSGPGDVGEHEHEHEPHGDAVHAHEGDATVADQVDASTSANDVSPSDGAGSGDAGARDASAGSDDEPAGSRAEAGAMDAGGGAGGTGGSGGIGGAGDSGVQDAASGASAESDVLVTIRFKAKVGSRDFACGTSYDAQGSSASTVTPQDMRLFIQDLALLDESGVAAPVTFTDRAPWQAATVGLLDFENQTGGCVDGTPDTNTELTGTVAPGKYTGIRFSNGVPEELNHDDPSTLMDPLKRSVSLMWSWQAGFRFSKIEMVNTVPGETDLGRAYFHPGATSCTGNPAQGTVMCAKSNRTEIVFQAFDPLNDTIVIDVAQLFKGTDLEVENECHSTPQGVCSPMFDAWGLNWADGAPKDGQTAFRLE